MTTRSNDPSDMLEPEDAKAAIRARRRKERSHRGERPLAQAAERLRDHILALEPAQTASCVSIYASRPFEPGTEPVIAAFAARGTEVLVPRLGDGLQRGWSVFTELDDLVERAPGRPPEPSGEFLDSDALARADLVLVPALSVDPSGTRLGQGGGWYDRALPHARPDAAVIALLFDDELSDEPLPTEPHDVPVHAVATPSGVTWLSA